ncbi:sensor histidine kinase [Desulfosporosinus shakirovi]|uniref:sensor histidine kinase n=1 Tax=Desulfosporosinus shakirovi TaxID=2885154 RepID=UPI001E63B282|nr:ATP-binding protein [Desulfosporosinus sp. SRJS8]MCB8815279.1 HAMP domain-containing protein [Desulfosporosinus sp. SRJS8]
MSKLWLAIVLIVLAVYLFSVVIQAQQITSLVYNQQARFFINEAEEVIILFNKYENTQRSIINDRLDILTKVLSAKTTIMDTDGNTLYGQTSQDQSPSKLLLEPGFREQVLSGKNVVFAGKIAGVNEELFLVAVPLIKDNKVIGSVVIYSPIAGMKQHVNNILGITLIGALIGIVLATVLSIFVSRKMIRPLAKMEETARLITEGEIGRQIQVTSEDEVGRLARSFNRMSTQLKEKIEAIERLDRLRQELLSDVSHELRTPLTVIQGFSEAVLDGLVKSKEQENLYLSNIIDESERLRRLVDDLLDLKGMEAVKSFDEMEYVVLNKLAQITVERLRNMANSKEITLTLTAPEQTITVWGNIDRLKQVLTNLLDNAIKHSEAGGAVDVELGIKNNYTYISVKNSGSGIPQGELENIWERFYKVDKSRSRRGTGTGLGLSIVKKIVEMHGGKVSAESEPGHGAVFTLYLPHLNELSDQK